MRTLVVSDNPLGPGTSHLRNVLRARLDAQGPALAGFEDLERRVLQAQPELVVLALPQDAERGLEMLRQARSLATCPVLAMGPAAEPKLILRALQDGADYYLDEGDLEGSLEAILARLQSKGDSLACNGRLVAVLAACGGTGASTLAANIAVGLAKEHGKSILIDLKPGRGDLAALLDLRPSFTLADLCLNVARLDQAMFEKALAPHASGVHLLAAPQMFGDTRMVTPQGVSQALTWAGRLFNHGVLDLEDCFHEEQQVALRLSAVILLVIRLDFTSLRNARRILDHCNDLGILRQQVKVVANRCGQAGELPVAEVEAALGMGISFSIPDDPRIVNGANNTGVPVVLKHPAAKVSQSINQVARLALERRRNGHGSGFKSAVARIFAR